MLYSGPDAYELFWRLYTFFDVIECYFSSLQSSGRKHNILGKMRNKGKNNVDIYWLIPTLQEDYQR